MTQERLTPLDLHHDGDPLDSGAILFVLLLPVLAGALLWLSPVGALVIIGTLSMLAGTASLITAYGVFQETGAIIMILGGVGLAGIGGATSFLERAVRGKPHG